ncbi:4-hydroxy-3-methylbut-2-enyl diphosphate reductase [Natronincola ferrireducens]|uniref:4-hydroxy-3-methylbut-2-enyl diphosphate reductase n=1 Tax=Natronincola ferrireducens TaxID=393762 RepID=A0A1G9CA97_9FIRM|nr:4-hydroxy-3-methylbut-2-enyl diphosphate reductase [Natronincola ferrireducens]SDK48608.1 4-hydroxy-3-methylbut-2-enyl diphosphate reductase [Natronincola ferrireducens]
MKVILADYSGFCFGVEKAINTTFGELEKKQKDQNIYSLGPLIHNNQVVKNLEEKGIEVIENIEDLSEGSIIIRSHGVSEKIYEELENKGLNIIDATCPFVRRIQNIVKNYYGKGYTIAIIGNSCHPEVIGINGWCNNQAIIINKEEDIHKVPSVDKLCIVVQTTMAVEQYNTISEKLENYAKEVVKFNTICLATKERQNAAKHLATKVDAMVVIGGQHSSNTQKLVSICKKIKPNDTFHVETIKDLPINTFKKYETIGVTAGASTPRWIISEAIETIRNI